MHRLNLRFIAGMFLAMVVVGGITHAAHRLQMHRHADAFLREARRARSAADLQLAASHLRRYVLLVPHDAEALRDYGEVLADLGAPQQAYLILNQSLRHNPQQDGLHQKLVELAMQLGRFADAQKLLVDEVLKQSPNDPEGWARLSHCQSELGQPEKALESLHKAIELAPDRLDLHEQAARLLAYRLERPDEASKTLDKMVEQNPENYLAYVIRGRMRLRGFQSASSTQDDGPQVQVAASQPADASRIAQCEQDAAKALELAPDAAEALLLAAELAARQRQFDKAREFAERGVALHPELADLHAILVDIELRNGSPAAAIERLRAGVAAVPHDTTLHWNLANLLIEQRQHDEAKKTLEDLRELGLAKPLVAFLEAKNLAISGNWLGGSRQLEAVRAELSQWPDIARQADFWLGKCYGERGRLDQQLVAYRRAVAADPSWKAARLALAGTLTALGRQDEAMAEYRLLVGGAEAPAEAVVNYVRLMLRQASNGPAARNNLTAVESLLERLGKSEPDFPYLPILRAELLLAQKKPEDAASVIEAARTQHPERIELWQAQIALAARSEDWDAAEALFADAIAQFPDELSLLALRGQYLVQRYGLDAGDALQGLAEQAREKFGAQSASLHEQLAVMACWIQKFPVANELAEFTAEQQPDNLRVRILQLEVAFQTKDAAAMKGVLTEIRRIDGEGPIWHYGEAVRLSLAAQEHASPDHLKQAQAHLVKALAARPSWSKVPLLSGRLYELQGQEELAIEKYREALALGERDPGLIRQLIGLLFQRGQFNEVDRLVRQLNETQQQTADELSGIAARAAFQVGDFERALALAQEAARRSGTLEDRLWLAQVLSVLKQPEQAEKELREAIAISPNEPAPWVMLVRIYAEAGNMDEARQALNDALEAVESPADLLLAAECHEILKDSGEARKNYEAALAASEDDTSIRSKVAAFYLRQGLLQEATAQYEILVDSPGTDAELAAARRQLALLLAARRRPADLQRARELIERNLASSDNTTSDRLAKAVVLDAQGSREARGEAIAILENIPARERQPQYDYLLGRLYLREGQWDKARRQLRDLATAHPMNASYTAAYVAALVDHEEAVEAEVWMERLRSLSPNEQGTAELQARVHFVAGRYEEVIRTLKDWAARASAAGPDAPSDFAARQIAWAAAKLEMFGDLYPDSADQELRRKFYEAAETLFAESSEAATRPLILAEYQARRGNAPAVLQVLAEHRQAASPAEIAAVAMALMQSEASDSDLERLQLQIDEALAQYPNEVVLLASAGDLAFWRLEYARALQYYEQALALAPSSVRCLNNGALALAYQGAPQEGLKMLHRAMEVVGPLPELLDTQGVILMRAGDVRQAISRFEAAVAERPFAEAYVHLALAQHALGQRRAALQSLEEARKLGLNPYRLHITDRQALVTLEQQAAR